MDNVEQNAAVADKPSKKSPQRKKLLVIVLVVVLILLLAGAGYTTFRMGKLASSADLAKLKSEIGTSAQEDRATLGELGTKITGLESTLGRVQSQVNDLPSADESSEYAARLDVALLSHSIEDLEVLETNDNNQQAFIEQPVNVVKLRVTNNSTFGIHLGNNSVAGRTTSGTLIEGVDIRSRDRKGQGLNIEIAPEGTVEVYAYFSNKDVNVVGVFIRENSESIEF